MVINVAYATDSQYAPICGVSIMSLIECNSQNDLCIYVLLENANDERERFEMLSNARDNVKIICIDVKDIQSRCEEIGLPKFKHGYGAWIRLFLADYLQVMKVLYIDCDTLILGDVGDLYSVSMGGDTIVAAVADILNNRSNILINRSRKNVYFNSGVMVMDLEKWKEKDINSRIVKALNAINIRATATCGDQDLLNYALSDEKEIISPRYNMTSLYRYCSPSKIKYMTDYEAYTSREIYYSKQRPIIYHFAGGAQRRPWYIGNYCKNCENELWNNYLVKSPWNSFVKPQINYSKLINIVNLVYNRFFPWLMLVLVKKKNIELLNNKLIDTNNSSEGI